jgi:hypothetical protein
MDVKILKRNKKYTLTEESALILIVNYDNLSQNEPVPECRLLRYIMEEDLPKASTVGSFFTMAWRFAIRITPNARVTTQKNKAKSFNMYVRVR